MTKFSDLESHTAEVLRPVVEALKPLAHPFAYGEPTAWPEEMEIDCCVSITFGDVLRARAALAGEGEGKHGK